MFIDATTRNVKVVFLASDLALVRAQLAAIVRSVGEANAQVHALSPTDDGERLQLVQITPARPRDPLTTRFWLYQVPTNPLSMFTRMEILRGADFVVVVADGRAPIDDSARWLEELRDHHASPLHDASPPRLLVQYIGPSGALRAALDPKGELDALVFDTDDAAQIGARTMAWIAR